MKKVLALIVALGLTSVFASGDANKTEKKAEANKTEKKAAKKAEHNKTKKAEHKAEKNATK
jgi:hypothetical protein